MHLGLPQPPPMPWYGWRKPQRLGHPQPKSDRSKMLPLLELAEILALPLLLVSCVFVKLLN